MIFEHRLEYSGWKCVFQLTYIAKEHGDDCQIGRTVLGQHYDGNVLVCIRSKRVYYQCLIAIVCPSSSHVIATENKLWNKSLERFLKYRYEREQEAFFTLGPS